MNSWQTQVDDDGAAEREDGEHQTDLIKTTTVTIHRSNQSTDQQVGESQPHVRPGEDRKRLQGHSVLTAVCFSLHVSFSLISVNGNLFVRFANERTSVVGVEADTLQAFSLQATCYLSFVRKEW